MKNQLLKIYGERNTGTNYLEKILNLNVDVVTLPGVVPRNVMRLQKILPGNELVRDIYFTLTYSKNLGWKHTFVKSDEELQKYKILSRELSFVTLTKNPYSWLLSLYKRPYHQYFGEKKDFISFLTRPWHTVGRENMHERVMSPVELWNKKNSSYLALAQNHPTLNIKFEDLLADSERILCLICETFTYRWKVKMFSNYNRSTKGENKDTQFYQDYYLNERWKEKLSGEALAIINRQLDDGIMSRFGYGKLY